MFRSKSLEGRCEQWAARLSLWPLEIYRIQRDEDGLAAIMDAGITPRDQLDQVAENLIPAKGRVVKAPPISLQMLEADYEGCLLSFDGAAKLSDRRGCSGCILFRLALAREVTDLIVVGDSRIAIQQAQATSVVWDSDTVSEIQCLNPRLQMMLNEFEQRRPKFKSVKFEHVKREFHSAAYYLTFKTLLTQHSLTIDDPVELAQLKQLNRIPEKLIKAEESQLVKPDAGLSPESEIPDDVIAEPVVIARVAAAMSLESQIFVVTRSQAQNQDDAGNRDRDERSESTSVTAEAESEYRPKSATPPHQLLNGGDGSWPSKKLSPGLRTSWQAYLSGNIIVRS
ncbi:unnamed protein product [Phytophthora lilii]|uniref:Unnamed protein product n=1 Tax=Phytophthora lilii TaxID=2077276 RepID=A0A9W6XF11_9STRA|nr:unnamed protein product [Phytophthora lilii]